jgi:hypothetical protein
MELIKRLFGGGGGSRSFGGSDDGMYFYVRPNGCEEVVRIRVNMMNDPSQRDEGGYWAHKYAELDVYFDAQRRFTHTELKGGTLVEQSDYEAWLAAQGSA